MEKQKGRAWTVATRWLHEELYELLLAGSLFGFCLLFFSCTIKILGVKTANISLRKNCVIWLNWMQCNPAHGWFPRKFDKAPNSLNLPMKLRNNWFKILLSRGKNYWLALEQEECGLCKTQSIGLVSPGSPGLPLPRCSDKPDQMLFLAKQLKEKCIFVAFSSALWNHKATCREKYFPRPVSAEIFPI